MAAQDDAMDEVSLERQLAHARAAAAGPVEGVFGRDSLTWRVDREAVTPPLSAIARAAALCGAVS